MNVITCFFTEHVLIQASFFNTCLANMYVYIKGLFEATELTYVFSVFLASGPTCGLLYTLTSTWCSLDSY